MCRRRRWTLRKWLLLVFGLVALAATADCYILAHIGAEPPTELTICILGMFNSAYLGYLGADCLDHNSANKYGARMDDPDADDEQEGE